jgi:molecular chaperone HtpG
MSEAKTLEFRTELKQLLDIIIHSLYTEREVFLRELVSNAADALDKLRFEAIAQPELVGSESEYQVVMRVDKDASTLTIADNGIGMNEVGVIEDLGTIARSGTRAFLETLREADAADRPTLIGQFGVGFYSSFMVADKVSVLSRRAGEEDAVLWTSSGDGEFSIEAATKESRGTEVTLHMKEDASEFLDEWRLRQIVKKYSDFLEHPVLLEVERPKEGAETSEDGDDVEMQKQLDRVNSGKALWLRNPSEITEEEHEEFYKSISHDFQGPARTIPYSAEGTLEYRAMMYLPKKKPFDFHWGEPKTGLQLYVQRVFILDQCEDLMPLWLRFVKGVVDSSDLSLNVSREMLQDSRVVRQIRKGLVNRVLKELEEMLEKDREAYLDFFAEFGPVLKEGVAQDHEHRERLAKLLTFTSTRTKSADGERVTLSEYVERMAEGQEKIYYLAGDDLASLKKSPYLEGLREKGHEVLLLTDTVDEFAFSALTKFDDHELQAVDHGDLEDAGEDVEEEKKQEFEGLLVFLKTAIEGLKEVRLSRRLRESAACLVVDDGAASANMERLFAAMGRQGEVPAAERILELNANHAAVRAMQKIYDGDPTDARVEDYGRLLYDQAVLAEGSKLKDPADLAQRINRLIEKTAEA